jgi:hypothetical protein
VIMKMNSYVLKSLHLRNEKHNEYTYNALHVRSTIICSNGMVVYAHIVLQNYYRVLCDSVVCKNISDVQTLFKHTVTRQGADRRVLD